MVICGAPLARGQEPAVWTDLTRDQNWETSANWLPTIVPNSPAADVQLSIDDRCVLNSSVNVGSLSLAKNASLLLSAGVLTLNRAQGGIKNAGLIVLGGGTSVYFGAAETISGRGRIALTGDDSRGGGELYVYGGTTVHQVEHTISGRGIVRLNGNVTLANHGTIAADQAGQTLTVNSEGTVTNDGLMIARNGATLYLVGGVHQLDGGTLVASGRGSVIQQGYYAQGSVIVGGTLCTDNGGLIRAFSSWWTDLTNEANIEIWSVDGGSPNNAHSQARLTNNGTITIRPTSSGFWNGLAFIDDGSGSATLDGTGAIALEGGSLGTAQIVIDRVSLRHGSSHLIHGYGPIDFEHGGALINDGTIRGDVPGMSLHTNGFGVVVTNNGVIEAVNGGIVGIEGALDQTDGGVVSADGLGSYASVRATNAFSNQEVTGGSFLTSNGGIVYVEGDAIVNGSVNQGTIVTGTGAGVKNFVNNGTVTISSSVSQLNLLGDVSGAGSIFLNGRRLFVAADATQQANHTIGGTGMLQVGSGKTFTNNGILNVGNSVGEITLVGNLKLGPTSQTNFTITSATFPGFSRIRRTAAGTTVLDGQLSVTLWSFVPQPSDTFPIIVTQSPIAGSFVNAPSGSRINTTDNSGSFLITYAGSNNVVLSDFGPPQPAVWQRRERGK